MQVRQVHHRLHSAYIADRKAANKTHREPARQADKDRKRTSFSLDALKNSFVQENGSQINLLLLAIVSLATELSKTVIRRCCGNSWPGEFPVH